MKMGESQIDEELQGTFPASDAPSWTLGFEPDRTLMSVMRIHAYGGPEMLCLDNVPMPQPNEDQVLVRVLAASINPIDCKLASGAIRPVMNNKAVLLPWVPGGYLVTTVNISSPELAQHYKVKASMMTLNPSAEGLEKLAALCDNGSLKGNINKIYPLFSAKQGWEQILAHHTTGKIVLSIEHSPAVS